MRSIPLAALVLVPSLLAGAWACGGKEAPIGEHGQQGSSSTAGAGSGAARSSESSEGSGAEPGAEASGAAASPSDCRHVHASGSSGGGGDGTYSCTTTHEYACASGDRSITCDCTGKGGSFAPGTCSCNGVTFAFDCANGCSPTAVELAKCGLPAPPQDPPSQGGSSSSSGGP